MRKTRAVEVDGDRLFETSPEKEASVVATAQGITMPESRKNHGPPCAVCGRRAGYAPKDRFGFPDPNPETPLAEMKSCPDCGLLSVCPDCLHEGDCCEVAHGHTGK